MQISRQNVAKYQVFGKKLIFLLWILLVGLIRILYTALMSNFHFFPRAVPGFAPARLSFGITDRTTAADNDWYQDTYSHSGIFADCRLRFRCGRHSTTRCGRHSTTLSFTRFTGRVCFHSIAEHVTSAPHRPAT